VIIGDGTPPMEHVHFNVTNLGERPVTINNIGWRVGKGKQRRYCIQPVSGPFTSHYPIELAHGKNATFMVSLQDVPDWMREFAQFAPDLSDRTMRTLVAQIFTSVGQTIEVRPEQPLVSHIQGAGRAA